MAKQEVKPAELIYALRTVRAALASWSSAATYDSAVAEECRLLLSSTAYPTMVTLVYTRTSQSVAGRLTASGLSRHYKNRQQKLPLKKGSHDSSSETGNDIQP